MTPELAATCLEAIDTLEKFCRTVANATNRDAQQVLHELSYDLTKLSNKIKELTSQ